MEDIDISPLLYLFAAAAIVAAILVLRGYAKRPKTPAILLCGCTGVGKSTLINALLGRAACPVGIGEPVTQHTTMLHAKGDAFAFYDSRGLEIGDASHTYLGLLRDLLQLRFNHLVRRQIDLVVMCIAEPSARFDEAHEEIVNLCEDLRIPLGIVLTKAQGDTAFRESVGATFKRACFIHAVRAQPLKLARLEVPAEGMPELTELLRKHAVTDLLVARRLQRQAGRASAMAKAVAGITGKSSDAAWTSVTGAAYQFLLSNPAKQWQQWLGDARGITKKVLVPGFIARNLGTKFDDSRIDGALARRTFPRILRVFGIGYMHLVDGEVNEIVKEALVQLQEQRPFRSRF